MKPHCNLIATVINGVFDVVANLLINLAMKLLLLRRVCCGEVIPHQRHDCGAPLGSFEFELLFDLIEL